PIGSRRGPRASRRTRPPASSPVAAGAVMDRRLLLSGASGFLGRALAPALAARGWTVLRLTRAGPQGPDRIRWDPERGRLDAAALGEVEAAVHLSGATIAGWWTPARRRRIRE